MDPFSSGNGRLDVQTGTSSEDYTTWANGFTPPFGAKTADNDSDSLTNSDEYAFGLDPQSGSSVNPRLGTRSRLSLGFAAEDGSCR